MSLLMFLALCIVVLDRGAGVLLIEHAWRSSCTRRLFGYGSASCGRFAWLACFGLWCSSFLCTSCERVQRRAPSESFDVLLPLCSFQALEESLLRVFVAA